MSAITVETARDLPRTLPTNLPRAINVALLGFGCIGSAVARLAARSPHQIQLVGALVRHPERPRADAPDTPFVLTRDADELLSQNPDVVVEVLGQLEPARTIVSDALGRGIAVVTANKSLVAAHGDELLEISARTGAPLLYEASVLAGVPFLGAFSTRQHASAVTRVTGIVNGTSNFIVSAMDRTRVDCTAALQEAQRLGYAEPDPRNDIDGIDAAEKLAVMLRHFGFGNVGLRDLEVTGIGGLRACDFVLSRDLGGALKPIVWAERHGEAVSAFVGPAFVPSAHRLAGIAGVENAVLLRNGYGELFYSGPGAGPAPTAATILDDVIVAAATGGSLRLPPVDRARAAVQRPGTDWFVRLTGPTLPEGHEIADLLGSHGVWLRRSSETSTTDGTAYGLLTFACTRPRLERALEWLEGACGCDLFAIRALSARGQREP
jgi:homoserine dehydrogenase